MVETHVTGIFGHPNSLS
ncbi:hypothetical protein F383_13678 [Gossypium arboreum]|uniref:Uncharacterized protein n=1 Tax=Gossypium arboreum TaxID=29729 RepID=A0A0B0NI57_GOSAR|nr:hypothetical protein F383_13678 [Gossypium arboreum]